MSRTVQASLLRLVRVIDPYTKDNQEIQGSDAAVTITGAANNGSGAIRLTAANHGRQTGQKIFVTGIVGTTEANSTAGNPAWTITRISSSTLDLVGSTFTNAWISGGTLVGALVGTADGATFTRQRHLDIYNEARTLLLKGLIRIKGLPDAEHAIRGFVTHTTITWTESGSQSTAPYPTGYVRLKGMSSATDVPIILLPGGRVNRVREGKDPYYIQSATRLHIFERAEGFIHYGTFMDSGSTYKISYVGISDYVIFTDVTGNSVLEAFLDEHHPLIWKIGEYIAAGYGSLELSTLVDKLIIEGLPNAA